MDRDETYYDTVFIDQTLGRNTEFTFDYGHQRGIEATLTSPSGVHYDLSSDQVTHDETFQIYRFNFPGITEVKSDMIYTFIVTQRLSIG